MVDKDSAVVFHLKQTGITVNRDGVGFFNDLFIHMRMYDVQKVVEKSSHWCYCLTFSYIVCE